MNKNIPSILVLVGVALLHAMASRSSHIPYVLFALVTACLLLAFWALLRIAGRTYLASIWGACIFACSSWLPLHFMTKGSALEMLSMRDALIDPNQISVSHGAGGYIGIFAALFACVGILIWVGMVIRKRFVAAQAETIAALVLLISSMLAFIASPISYPSAIIACVAALAWFASLGLDRMQRFIGLKDKLANTLLIVLVCIAVIDLVQVAAGTLQYGLGI